MNVLKKIQEKKKEGGVSLVLSKVLKVLKIRTVKYIRKIYYGIISKIKSPILHKGILIPTKNKVFNLEIAKRFEVGSYEIEEVEAVKKHIKNPKAIIDLGASSGFLSAYLKVRFPECKVISLEANPHMFDVMQEVKDINKCNFYIEKKAYHSSAQKVSFSIHKLSVGGSIQRKTGKRIEVKSTNLQQLVRKYNLEGFCLIVDIEGGEADLINNEIDIIESMCKTLIVEFHDGYGKGIKEAKERLRNSKLKFIEEKENELMIYKNNI